MTTSIAVDTGLKHVHLQEIFVILYLVRPRLVAKDPACSVAALKMDSKKT